MRDAAAFARRCGQLCTLALMEPLAKVATSLERFADQLAAARIAPGGPSVTSDADLKAMLASHDDGE